MEMFPKLSSVQRWKPRDVHRRQLKNAPYNPRTIDEVGKAKLRKSLEEFGLVQPPVWNETTGNLVGGHQRVADIDAVEGTDDYQLTVAVVNMDATREKALNVILNSPEVGGRFDDNLLKRLMIDVEGALNFDLNDFVAKQETKARDAVRKATPKPKPIDATYEVVIECKDEEHQRRVFELVIAQGEKCRLLTL
jgi:hypothetical protein